MSILDDSLSHIDSSKPSRFSTKPKKSFWSKFTPAQFVGLASLALLVFAVPVAIVLNQSNQDTRNQAFNPNGVVVITGRQLPNTFIADGRQGEIVFNVNTANVSIDGIQLTFNVSGTLANAFLSTVTSEGMNGYSAHAPIIIDNPDGSKKVGLLIDRGGSAFTTTNPVDIRKLKFTVSTPGTLTFTFPDGGSLALRSDTEAGDPAADSLLPLQPMTFTAVLPTSTPTPTTVPSSTLTPSLTPSRTPTAGAGSTTPSQTPTLTPSRTPTLSLSSTIAPSATAPSNPTSTVIPTTTSGVGACTTISMNFASTGLPDNAPRIGHTVNFVCGEMVGASRYQFRIREPGSTVYVLRDPVAAGSRVSQSYTINNPGDFVAQCRMCTGAADSTCLDWEQ